MLQREGNTSSLSTHPHSVHITLTQYTSPSLSTHHPHSVHTLTQHTSPSHITHTIVHRSMQDCTIISLHAQWVVNGCYNIIHRLYLPLVGFVCILTSVHMYTYIVNDIHVTLTSCSQQTYLMSSIGIQLSLSSRNSCHEES